MFLFITFGISFTKIPTYDTSSPVGPFVMYIQPFSVAFMNLLNEVVVVEVVVVVVYNTVSLLIYS